nr:probable E3 ubiquitin-protein ligase RNF144A-B [Ipomoea batatas]
MREADGTTIMKAISVEDYKSKNVIMVAKSSGYGMNRVVIDLSQSQGTLGVPRVIIDLTQDNPDDEIQILEAIMTAPATIKPECSNSKPVYINMEDALETSTSLFIYAICFDAKLISDIFIIKACKHTYFSDCISKFVVSKLQQNVPQINCPVSGCTGVVEPHNCRLISPPQVFDRWGDALCEALDGSLKLRQSGDSDNNNRSAPDFVTPSLEEGEREQREGSRKNVEISIEGHVPVPPMKNSGPSPQGSGHVPVPPMKNSGPSPQGSGHGRDRPLPEPRNPRRPRVVIDLTQDNPDDEIQILEAIMSALARIKPECSNSKPVYIDVEDAMETSTSLFI